MSGHKHSGSISQNQKAQLANAYNELGKELSSTKVRVIGNYTLGKVIGEGAYGKVRMGTHRLTSTKVAIKQIPKAMSASLTREIHHHRQLHHPHITQMFEVIATESSIWIVTELCSGGELFDYLVEKGRLTESETKLVFGQLCLAVAYLHEKGIVHRDLKLENVLLDERCRVKLGDFGFTREFERGSLMETFCGTTGYASPEMLQGHKYTGPEVDVWSLGVILYCLLTGMLPFDDDDEGVMRDKIIVGEFEDPDWLSTESRDLIKSILQKDASKRLTISQILAHPWFTSRSHHYDTETPEQPSTAVFERTPSPEPPVPPPPMISPESSVSHSSTSESSFRSASSEFDTSTPTTPAESSEDPFIDDKPQPTIHPNPSEATIRKLFIDMESLGSRTKRHPETVLEEEGDDAILETPSAPRRLSSSSSRAPPMHTVRTPARTKRRSVSSTLSDPSSPIVDKTPMPSPNEKDIDFASLLSTPAPIIFSTPTERYLLNSLSTLGLDLGQIVYSVMNDACDAAGALWWMLMKKAEKKVLEEGVDLQSAVLSPAYDMPFQREKPEDGKRRKHCAVAIQTDPVPLTLGRPPQLGIVPPTPVAAVRPSTTPPRAASPSRSPMLTPSSSLLDTASRSHPSTPGKDRDSTKSRKNRSGSVSIMQRATTALEAAGLVRKKSSEFREQHEREKSKDIERKSVHADDPRPSNISSRLTKSPPPGKSRSPTTPPPDLHHSQPHIIGSPWVMAESKESLGNYTAGASAPTPTNSPGGLPTSLSNPNFGTSSSGKAGSHRNRANLLTAFRLWFNEDRKGKRKETAAAGSSPNRSYNRSMPSPAYSSSSVTRRTSGGNSGYNKRTTGRRAHRASVSSRRSSSVNSRRSSVASVQMVVLDSPPVQPRRSMGSHTPNSERGEHSSRPSSIRSFSMQRHRKSPSASSTGSAHFRTSSPMQKYHRRGGSGSSTRVVRQHGRPPHHRSNSATSSVHSPVSSRPTSYIEHSENEGRAMSPYKSSRREDTTPRRGQSATFVAQKRQGPFSSPGHGHGTSLGRSSWKKSWGLEPPGWQTRTTHLPVEVLVISPAIEPVSLRDVFSGRISTGDESDWVDEDDDIPYAVGLGQNPLPISTAKTYHTESTVTLSPAPRGHRSSSKRTKGPASQNASSSSRTKAVPAGRASPVQAEYEGSDNRASRRQLPPGRSGPAFRQPIQEEDEGEEE
ncbi:Pkinase-domain-containing protein [Mycena floridula]|nr:Pkinase-domain-containing protein [Mycena floridula]